MTKYTISVTGMKCPKCEAHASSALTKLSGSKKVVASHESSLCILTADDGLTDEAIREAIASVGYAAGEIKREAVEKKGLFSKFKK